MQRFWAASCTEVKILATIELVEATIIKFLYYWNLQNCSCDFICINRKNHEMPYNY